MLELGGGGESKGNTWENVGRRETVALRGFPPFNFPGHSTRDQGRFIYYFSSPGATPLKNEINTQGK